MLIVGTIVVVVAVLVFGLFKMGSVRGFRQR